MKILTLYALQASVALPVLVLSGAAIEAKMLLVFGFLAHAVFVLLHRGNAELKPEEPTEKISRSEFWYKAIAYSGGIVLFMLFNHIANQ